MPKPDQSEDGCYTTSEGTRLMSIAVRSAQVHPACQPGWIGMEITVSSPAQMIRLVNLVSAYGHSYMCLSFT